MTFNQLLAKYGYIEEESMTKKKRDRPWQIQTIKHDDSDTDDSD